MSRVKHHDAAPQFAAPLFLQRSLGIRAMDLHDAIPLSSLIAHLRKELSEAQYQGEGRTPKFQIPEVELELEVAVTSGAEGGGGVKFWVLNADAKTTREQILTQTIRLKLKPTDETGGDYEVSDHDAPPGRR